MDNKNRKEMIEKVKLLSPFEIKEELIQIKRLTLFSFLIKILWMN